MAQHFLILVALLGSFYAEQLAQVHICHRAAGHRAVQFVQHTPQVLLQLLQCMAQLIVRRIIASMPTESCVTDTLLGPSCSSPEPGEPHAHTQQCFLLRSACTIMGFKAFLCAKFPPLDVRQHVGNMKESRHQENGHKMLISIAAEPPEGRSC